MCNFCVDHVDSVDYKAVNRLRRYVSDRARIDSSKKTGTCAKHQRMVRRAIVKARFMALLPYSPDHTRVTNMLAPRTPAEAAERESGEASTDVTDGTPGGESAAQSAPAPAVGAVVQAAEMEASRAVGSAPVAESASAETTQQAAPSASTASVPDVAQSEGKSETDDREEAKV